MVNPSFNRMASTGSSLAKVAAIVNLEFISAGTSFKLCTAMSALPFSNAISSLDTNKPLPPIVCKGASVRSPSDSISIISHTHRGSKNLILSITSFVCSIASGDSLVAILIFIVKL